MLAAVSQPALATAPASRRPSSGRRRSRCIAAQQRDGSKADAPAEAPVPPPQGRRQLLSAAAGAALLAALQAPDAQAVIKGYEPMPMLEGKDYGKSRMTFSDYVQSPSGLQYYDIREGTGATPQAGQTCVVDWAGVTIGYYGRPFEARNKPKGSAFSGEDKDFFRFKLGDSSVIPAFNEAVAGMKVGGIRRIIVPVELGYPDNDYNKAGPKPSTFSGQRALGFVLGNQGMIDKTLLFDIELRSLQ